MAATEVQQPNTPSVTELLFVLSETIKVVGHTQAYRYFPTRDTLQKAIVRILGIHTKGVSGAVSLDNGPIPTLLVAFDNPSFLSHVETATNLLRTFASAATGSDSDALRAAQGELINYILRRSLGPHAVEYSQLRNRLQHDLDTGLVAEETPWPRAEAEIWCKGLTYALGVINKAPDLPISSDDFVDMDSFWGWAKQQYCRLRRQGDIYAHVAKYSEPPSAANLLRYVDHIVRAISPPIMVFTDPEGPDHSSFMWLHDLTTKTLQSSHCTSFESSIDPERLPNWLSGLVYNPCFNAHISRDVVEAIINTETVGEKWTGYVNEASVHPEVTHLFEVIGNRLTASENDQRIYSPLVACTRTSCPACVLCYEATKKVYKLEPMALYLFPTEGEPSRSPCCIPPLPQAVEQEFKIMLSKEIKFLVLSAIFQRTPKMVKPWAEKAAG